MVKYYERKITIKNYRTICKYRGNPQKVIPFLKIKIRK